MPGLRAAGATVVAISPEKPEFAVATGTRLGLEYLMLTDEKSAYARRLGLAFGMTPELTAAYGHFGIDIAAANAFADPELPITATFVVDTRGKIVLSYIDADYRKRLEPAQILEAVKSLKRVS